VTIAVIGDSQSAATLFRRHLSHIAARSPSLVVHLSSAADSGAVAVKVVHGVVDGFAHETKPARRLREGCDELVDPIACMLDKRINTSVDFLLNLWLLVVNLCSIRAARHLMPNIHRIPNLKHHNNNNNCEQ
jgi:hypothetical protein